MQVKDYDEDYSTKTRLENRFADFIDERAYCSGDTYLEDKNHADISNPVDVEKESLATIAAYKRGFVDAILLFIK